MKEKLLEENMFKDLWINGVKVYEPKIFEDERGLFFESYNNDLFFNNGITCEFVQDHHSKSLKKYTIITNKKSQLYIYSTYYKINNAIRNI